MSTTDHASSVLAGVDFSQVDLSRISLRIGLALVVLQLGSLAAIPARLLSPRFGKAWRGGLCAFVALGWAGVFVGVVWPELTRGRDWFDLISLVGGLVVAPLVTLLASLAVWLRWRGEPSVGRGASR